MAKRVTTKDEHAGIHLVNTGRTSRSDKRRLRLGEYAADIVISKREANCCYYVLQRVGCPEILDLHRFNTAEDAEKAAHVALKRWNGEDLVRRLAS